MTNDVGDMPPPSEVDVPVKLKKNDGRGDFFAIDRRAWQAVCKLGLNPMVCYLTMARGTLADQRTTSWSVNACEGYAGVSRPVAQKAIKALIDAGIVRLLKAGTKPRYLLLPPHDIPGCEGYASPVEMTPAQQAVYDALRGGKTHLAKAPARWCNNESPFQVGKQLVAIGRATGDCVWADFAAIVPDQAPISVWTWLPNDLIDGAASEVAPVNRLRQKQSAVPLRLLIDLYNLQDLSADGGIHWTQIRQGFDRKRVGQRGPYIVWGFTEQTVETWGDRPLFRSYLANESNPATGLDRGEETFWSAWRSLLALGLVETVPHLVEADNDGASIICPYGIDSGEDAERDLADAAHEAALAMITDGQKADAEVCGLHLAPVLQHMDQVAMVGIVRLRYRPRTRGALAWWARMPEWQEMAEFYRGLAEDAAGYREPVRLQHQC